MVVPEYIYYGECHHIFCDDIRTESCIKRYYEVFDINDFKVKIIAICNEFVRLKVREKHFANDYKYYNTPYEAVICEIIMNQLEINQHWRHYQYIRIDVNNIDPVIMYCVCERPPMFCEVKLSHAITLLQSVDYLHQTTSSFNFLYHYLIKNVINTISQMISYYSKHGKYSYQSKNMESIMNFLNKNRYGIGEDYVSGKLSELFIIFLEIQSSIINHKKKSK